MTQIMKNTIKRANTLNESHYRLKEVTQRVLALAIEQAQEIKRYTGQDLILAGTKTIVVADYYAKIYGVDKDTAYAALKVAMEDLYQAEYHWKELDQDGNINEYRTRFVSHIGYLGGQGAVEFVLTEQARMHILNLTKNFTWYEIRQLSQLSKYSIRLYELLCQYRSTGKLIIGLDDLREKLGLLSNEYEYLGNFKARVLDFAIDEILKFTDIEKLGYEQEKQGRTIVGFKFSFRFKTKEKSKILDQKDPDTIDILHGLTDKELVIVRQKVADYIAHLENKGEPVNDFHKKNIEQKAIADRWGLDEYYEQLQTAENERLARKEQAERERQADLAKQAEKQRQEAENRAFIEHFESLPQDEQALIIDEVGQAIEPFYKQFFDKSVKNGSSHKDLMYREVFKRVMGV